MSWLHTLLPASFRGVHAEVTQVKDTGENALAEHAYPYRNGADVENFGRDAHKVPVEFVLWGKQYEAQLKKLVSAFEVLDAGELIHPIFGSMQCHAKNWEVSHSAEEYNYCTVSVTFIEANADMAFFNRSLPNALGGLAALQCMATFDALLTQFEAYMEMAQGYLEVGSDALALLRDYWQRMVTPLFELKQGVLQLGGDVFALPRSALGDVMALFGVFHGAHGGQFIISPPVQNPQTVAGTGVVINPAPSRFNPLYTRDEAARGVELVQKQVQNALVPVLESEPFTPDVAVSTSPAQVKAVFNASVAVVNAVSAAQAIAQVFEWDLIDPTLSPPQVEQALNQVRAPLAQAALACRTAYTGDAGIVLAQHLQDLAWQLTAAARAVIYQKPALTAHALESDTNLHLLAHKLYGDYTRAYEIARLNYVKNPNVLLRGEVLNVYSN